MTSCGIAVERGRSYSVITTLVERPLSRGSGLSAYSHCGVLLKLIEARYSARGRSRSASTTVRSRISLRFCGSMPIDPGAWRAPPPAPPNPFVGVCARLGDPLVGGAAGAAVHEVLLLRRAREARHPFAAGELGREA